jgi:hypothetical protein
LPNSGAAAGFGLEQRPVRRTEYLFVQPVGSERDADAHADLDNVTLDLERLFQRLPNPERDLGGIARVPAAKDGELVTARSRHEIIPACAGLEPPRGEFEQPVARRVATGRNEPSEWRTRKRVMPVRCPVPVADVNCRMARSRSSGWRRSRTLAAASSDGSQPTNSREVSVANTTVPSWRTAMKRNAPSFRNDSPNRSREPEAM